MNGRQKRQLRRAMRREAFDFKRDQPQATGAELTAHLEEEFGGVGFDPAFLQLIIRLLIELFFPDD